MTELKEAQAEHLYQWSKALSWQLIAQAQCTTKKEKNNEKLSCLQKISLWLEPELRIKPCNLHIKRVPRWGHQNQE